MLNRSGNWLPGCYLFRLRPARLPALPAPARTSSSLCLAASTNPCASATCGSHHSAATCAAHTAASSWACADVEERLAGGQRHGGTEVWAAVCSRRRTFAQHGSAAQIAPGEGRALPESVPIQARYFSLLLRCCGSLSDLLVIRSPAAVAAVRCCPPWRP